MVGAWREPCSAGDFPGYSATRIPGRGAHAAANTAPYYLGMFARGRTEEVPVIIDTPRFPEVLALIDVNKPGDGQLLAPFSGELRLGRPRKNRSGKW